MDDSSYPNSEYNEIRKQKILDWINKQWISDKKCPICRSNQWNINLDPGIILVAKNQQIQSNENYPFVIINCQKCGYSFLMNEVVMGLANPSKSQDFDASKKEDK